MKAITINNGSLIVIGEKCLISRDFDLRSHAQALV